MHGPSARLVAGVVIALAMVATSLSRAPHASAQQDARCTTRVAGVDRIATATRLAPRDADTVVLARADDAADALSGVALARALEAPLLLTQPASLSEATRAWLADVRPSRLVVLGGAAAVTGETVARAARVAGSATVERVGGSDRAATAALVAARVDALTDVIEVVLVQGRPDDLGGGWADAVSAGGLSDEDDRPLLLLDGGLAPQATMQAVRRLDPRLVLAVGGERAVPESSLVRVAAGRPTARLAGVDRYATSRAVADEVVGTGPVADLLVTTGRSWPDALVAGATADGATLVLVPDPIDAATASWLADHVTGSPRVRIVGGTDAVPDATRDAIDALCAGAAPDEVVPPEGGDDGRAYPGQPDVGTVLWGAAVGGNSDPVGRHEVPAGAPLAVRRTFFAWSHITSGYLLTTARDDLAQGRLPWVSVKTPGWATTAAGDHDDELDRLLTDLDALPGPVWLTVHHEPEGGGGNPGPDDPAGPAGHLALNRHVRERMTALGTDNIALAPILMAWTFDPRSGRDPDQWWQDGIYDFVGIDHYREVNQTLLTDVWADVRRWAEARDVDIAVGEWGVRGTDATAGGHVRDWYRAAIRSGTDGAGARVVGLAAFDSGLNSPNGSWELAGAQLTTFHDLLTAPTTAHTGDNP